MDVYHVFTDLKGVALVASLEDVHVNAGDLSFSLYVHGQAMSEEQGEYATVGFVRRGSEGQGRKLRTIEVNG